MSVAKFFLDFWPYLAVIAAVLAVGFVVIVVIPMARENRLKGWYASEAEFRIMMQHSEMDRGFWARYERECERFRGSGNKAALIQVPLLPYPFNTHFEFEFFGVTYRRSTVGESFEEYMRSAVRFHAEFKSKWEQKVFEDFDMATFMHGFKKQEPLDKADIWTEYQKRGSEK